MVIIRSRLHYVLRCKPEYAGRCTGICRFASVSTWKSSAEHRVWPIRSTPESIIEPTLWHLRHITRSVYTVCFCSLNIPYILQEKGPLHAQMQTYKHILHSYCTAVKPAFWDHLRRKWLYTAYIYGQVAFMSVQLHLKFCIKNHQSWFDQFPHFSRWSIEW